LTRHGMIGSDGLTATVLSVDSEIPSTPLDFRGGGTSPTDIILGWSPSTDNVGVTAYKVYRSVYPAEPQYIPTITTNLTPQGMLAYDSGLSPNTRYFYKVSAIDAAGN